MLIALVVLLARGILLAYTFGLIADSAVKLLRDVFDAMRDTH